MDELKIVERIATIEQDNKAINRRLGNLEKLTESVHTMAVEMKSMREDANSITERVEEIERRPAKRYETFVAALITAVVGILVGYFIRF